MTFHFATQGSSVYFKLTIDHWPLHSYSSSAFGNECCCVITICFVFCCSSGGGNCFRCFHLSLHSINVLQVRTEGLDKCYTSEDAAVHTCPGNARAPGTGPQEILLYSEYCMLMWTFYVCHRGVEIIADGIAWNCGRFWRLRGSLDGDKCVIKSAKIKLAGKIRVSCFLERKGKIIKHFC